MASVGISAAWASPPLEAYGQLPTIQEMDISPDGQHLALLVGKGAVRRVQVRNASDLKLLTTTPVDKMKVRSLLWAGPDHLLILYTQAALVAGLDGPQREWQLGAVYDLKSGRYSGIMDDPHNALNTIFGTPMYRRVRGRDMLYFIGEYFRENQGLFSLYAYDVASRVVNQVDVGDSDTQSWMVDDNGVPNGRVEYSHYSGKWTFSVKTLKGWITALTEMAPLDEPSLDGLGRDGQSALVEMGGKIIGS